MQVLDSMHGEAEGRGANLGVLRTLAIVGWWVLWAWTGAGWEGVWAGERVDCLRALKSSASLSTPFTCIPAGILLRSLRLREREVQSPGLTLFAEFDVAPEFQP